jgi:deoxyribodipyrimidine photo-lyase
VSNCTIVWFRRDLRLSDHAPLDRAARRGAVIPVFVLDRALLHHPETSPARVAFMLECLRSLDADLRDRGGRLIVRYGDPVTVLPQLIRDTQADGIYAHIDFERLYGRVRDARLNHALVEQNLKIRWFEPAGTTAGLVTTGEYRQLWYDQMSEAIVPTPTRIEVPSNLPSEPLPTLADLNLLTMASPFRLLEHKLLIDCSIASWSRRRSATTGSCPTPAPMRPAASVRTSSSASSPCANAIKPLKN